MQITHLGHACLLVESADVRVLIDPGSFTGDFTQLRDLHVIVVTHQHRDHLDPERLPELVRANTDALLLCAPDSVEVLRGVGLEPSVHQPDGTLIGDLTITPVGAIHALIHEEIPRISNVGVRLSAPGEPSLFHPGDALDGEPGPVDVLAFPLNAPWQRSREMTAFVRRIGARQALPIHDALLSSTGRGLYLGQARTLGSPDTEVRDLAGRGAVLFS